MLLAGDEPVTWPKAEEASRAVREYLTALDAARSNEADDDKDSDGSSGSGSGIKPAKEVSRRRSTGGMGYQAGRRPILCL